MKVQIKVIALIGLALALGGLALVRDRHAGAAPAAPGVRLKPHYEPLGYCPDGYESNNSASSPAGPFTVAPGSQFLISDMTFTATTTGPDMDFYGINVIETGYMYTVTVTPGSSFLGINLEIYDTGSSLKASRTGTLGASVTLSWWASQSGTYKVKTSATNPGQFDPCAAGNTYSVLIQRAESTVSATPTPTNTPSPTPTPTGGTVLTDTLEGTFGNNSFDNAVAISPGSSYKSLTFYWQYPVPDIDFFKMWTKANRIYQVKTEIAPGLDTVIDIYNCGADACWVTNNDDRSYTDVSSLVEWTAGASDGWYYIRVINKDPTDPRYKLYNLVITLIEPDTPTPTRTPTATGSPEPGPTPVTGYDQFEPNPDFEHATTIGLGVQYKNLNFVPYTPWAGHWEDNDFFKLRVKPGLLVKCETLDLSSGTDTNIILYSEAQANECGRRPVDQCQGLAGNDDVNTAAGDFRSQVWYFATYEGWLYILVGQGHPVPLEEASKYTYSFQCTVGSQATATPTPGPTSTSAPVPTLVPLPTRPPAPVDSPTPVPPTPAPTAPPTPLPPIVVNPLPTSTPPGPPRQVVNIELRVFYDRNENNQPDVGEGIIGLQAQVYDLTDGALLAQGFTDETGLVTFSVSALGSVRVVVAYMNFEVVVPPNGGALLVRVSPRQLPSVIP